MKNINHHHLLMLILILAAFTRFFRLDTPHDYVFDEVYHAYTAQEVAYGNVAAWEWWTDPPEEFAYEWTHPPLSKLIMAVGVRAFSWLPTNLKRIPNPTGGDPIAPVDEGGYPEDVSEKGHNPLGWRIPVAIFGVGIVYVLYLIGKELFSKEVGLVAAFLATFDGLFFVMARIGMNDTFYLFFQLGAFYMIVRWLKGDPSTAFYSTGSTSSLQAGSTSSLQAGSTSSLQAGSTSSLQAGSKRAQDDNFALKSLANLSNPNRYLVATGVFLGLALASKWTAIYGILLFAGVYSISYIVFSVNNKKYKILDTKYKIQNTIRYILRGAIVFLAIPVFVYVISYIPFLTSGHTLAQLWQLQQQMWWYHTNLEATHGYQSTALSWPLMIRPVWYYVNYAGEKIVNIYALGNPVIWWGGVVAIIATTVASIKYLVLSIKRKKYLLHTTSYLPIRSDARRAGRQGLLLLLVAYFAFLLPWVVSPRIMFLYHYMPSLSFLILILAYMLVQIARKRQQGKFAVGFYLMLVVALFIYFYPYIAAVSIPREWADQYVWFPGWK